MPPKKSIAQRKLEHAQRRAIPILPNKRIKRHGAATLPMNTTRRIGTRASPSRGMTTTEAPLMAQCNWESWGLCQVSGAASAVPISLVNCQVVNCGNQLHHMCQTTWESLDPTREAHGNSYYCTKCHPCWNIIPLRGDEDDIIPETQVPCLPPLLPRTPMCDGDNNVLTYTASSPSLSSSSASSEGEKDISQTLLSPMQQRDESDGDDLSLSESIVDSTVYVTDAEASKYDFLQRLKHYMNNNKITMQNRQSVEIAIMIEAGTIIRNGNTIKKNDRAKEYYDVYIRTINEIDNNEFEDKTVYDSMILSYHGAKSDNEGNMLLRKLAIVMTEVKKFAYKFPGIGSLTQLPSGSNQISDMMRPYVIQLWSKKYPVQYFLL